MFCSFKYYNIWVLLIYIACTQISLSQIDTVKVKINSHRQVMTCGTDRDRQIQVSINIGNILVQDSLYYYDILLSYNPDKIALKSELPINTLGEYFNQHGFTLMEEPGQARVWGLQWGATQVYGNKPLIAILGEFLGDCPDTAHINLLDMDIEVRQSLLDRFDMKDVSKAIEIIKKENEEDFISTEFMKDTINKFDDDSIAVVIMKMNTNEVLNLENIEIELELSKKNMYKISEIKSISNNIEIDSLIDFSDENNEIRLIKARVFGNLDNEEALEIRFKRLVKENDTTKIYARFRSTNDCACVTRFINDNVSVINKADSITSTYNNENENNKYNIDVFYHSGNREIIIRDKKFRLIQAKIYNLNGNMIMDKRYINPKSEIRFNANSLTNGVYVSKIKLINGLEENIVLIIN